MSSLDRLSDFLVQLDKNKEQDAAAAAPVPDAAPESALDALANFAAQLDLESAPGAAPGSAPGEQDLTAAAAKMYENEVVLPESVGWIPREIERGARGQVSQAAQAIATPGMRAQLIQSIYNGAWTLAELVSAGMGPAMREIRIQSPELKQAVTGAAAQETSMAIERAAFDTQMDPTRIREELIAAQGAAQGTAKGQREGIGGDIARATGQSLTQFAAMAPAVALGTPVAGAAMASQLYLPGSTWTAGALEYIDQTNRDRAAAAMEGRDIPEFNLSDMRDYAATSAVINTGVELGGAALGGKIIGKIAKTTGTTAIGQAALKPLIDRGMPIVDRVMVSKVGSKGLQTFARLSENTLEFRNGFFGKALAMGATSAIEEGGEELVTAALMAPFTSAPLSEDIANGLYSAMIGLGAGGVGGVAPAGAFAVRQGVVNVRDSMRPETDRERVLRQIHTDAMQRKTNWSQDLTEEQNARLSTALDSVNGMDQEQRGAFLRELGDRRIDARTNADNLLTQRQQLDIGLTGALDLAENGTDEEKATAKDQAEQIRGQIAAIDEQLQLATSDAMMADAQYSAVAEKIGEMPATIDQAAPEQVLTDVSTRAGVELKPTAMPKNGARAQKQIEALGRKVVWFRPSQGTFSPAFHSMRSKGVVYMNADAAPANVLANALEEVFHDIQMFQPELAQVFMDKAGLMPVYQAGVAYAAQGTKESEDKARMDRAALAQAESAVAQLEGEQPSISPEAARMGAARIEQEGTANAFAAAARATGSGSILAPLQQFAARRGLLGRDVMAAMAVLDAASRAAAVETVEGTKPVATLSPLARTLLWANDMNLDFKGELDAAESYARGELETQAAPQVQIDRATSGATESMARAKQPAEQAVPMSTKPKAPTAFNDFARQVTDDVGLSPSEARSTVLEYMTGKPGRESFDTSRIGGKKDIVKWLHARRMASGLRVLTLDSTKDRKVLSRLMAAEAVAAIRAEGNALAWYDEVISDMLAKLSLSYPELATDVRARNALIIAIAITSQGQNVEDNLTSALKVYEQYRSTVDANGVGEFPLFETGEEGAAMKSNFIMANAMMKKHGPEMLSRFLRTPFRVDQLRKAGFKIGGEIKTEMVLGSAIFGPKIGFGFMSNLFGNFDPVTMDMWFMRTIGRLMGKLPKFRQELFDQQVTRFRNSLSETGTDGLYADQFPADLVAAAADPNQLDKAIELATSVKKRHEAEYRKNAAAFKAGERNKTNLVYSSSSIIQSLTEPIDAPTSGKQRHLMRLVVKDAVDAVSRITGTDVPSAAFQALIWYPEQYLWSSLGAKLRVIGENYSNVATKILVARGIERGTIDEAVRVSRESRPARVQPMAGISVGARGAETGGQSGLVVPFTEGERTKFITERGAPDISYARASDADYLAAVQRGDMATAQRMVDAAAKAAGYTQRAYKAMPSTDSEGQPITVIQRPTEFPAFNRGERGIRIAGFFAEDRGFAEKFSQALTKPPAPIYEVYLREQTPYVIDAAGRMAGDVQFGVSGQEFRDAVRSGKYDSIIIRNTKDEGTIHVALNPNQIKSADPIVRDSDGNVIPLSQRFDTSRAEISYARASDADYLAAVQRGDMDTAQRMVDAAAKAAGYWRRDNYQRKWAFKKVGITPREIESEGIPLDRQTEQNYESWNTENATVFDGLLETMIQNNGDIKVFQSRGRGLIWTRYQSITNGKPSGFLITSSPVDVEKSIEKNGIGNQNNIFAKYVLPEFRNRGISTVLVEFALNDLGTLNADYLRTSDAQRSYSNYLERGFIKSADPVTYDEQGNVIPLSQRFDTSRAEISYARPDEDAEVTALRQQIEDLKRQMRDVQNTTAAQRVNALREVRVLERKLSAAQLIAEQKIGQAARISARLEIQKQVNRDAKQAAEEAAAQMSTDLESARATVASLRQQLREAKSNADTEDLLREAEKKLDRVANWSYAIGRNEGLVAGQVAGMQQERREQLRVIKPLKERLPLVEARLAKATEDLRAARKQIAQDEKSAQNAADFAYQLGLRSGQVQGMMRGRLQILRKLDSREATLVRQIARLKKLKEMQIYDLRKEYKERGKERLQKLRDRMAEQAKQIEEVRDIVREIATDAAQTLPMRLRGPLAVRIANAKTIAQANRIAVEATKLAINEEVSSTLKTIARLKKQMNKRGMKYDTRVQIETLLRDADAALRQANRRRIQASVGVMKNAAGKSMGAAIINAVNVYSQVADAAAKVDAALVLYTNDAAAFKAEKEARVAKYQADTAALVANMQGRPNLPMRDRTDQPPRTSLARRIRVANSDIYTLQLELEGKSDGIINKLLTAAQQGKGASALEHAAIIRQLEPLLQAAGYSGLDDYALKNGMMGQTLVNPVTVTLGGGNVTIPVGTMLSIAAMDDETLAIFPKAGEPLTQGVRFPGSRTTTTIYPTREEIMAIKAGLTPGQQGLVDGMKAILETQIRDRTMDAIWKIEGDQPPIVQNYWPRIRDMAGFEGESAAVLNAAGALVRGALTSVGFANARTGGNRPLLYSDAFQTWDRHVQVALDMIHMAQPYRDAATVLSDQQVVSLMDRQMGPGTANAVLSIFSNGVGATARTNATIIDKLTNNVTGAVLSLSPRTWAKVQTGGVIRLASEVGPVYLAEGTARATAMLRSPAMWQARVEQIHSQSGYFTHRHQMNMRSIMSGSMSEQDRIKVMTAAKAVYKSIAAATTTTRAANFTDTLNSLGDATDNANIVLSSLVDVLRAIDENIMLTAVEARLSEAKDQGYVGAAAFAVAVERAEQDFRRSQNPSDEFDETAFAAETRTSNKSPGWRLLFPFSSDSLKARNQIRRAWISGERRGGTALAIGGNLTTNAIINAASVMTLLYIAKTISSALGGADEPTDEEDKAFDKAVKELPPTVAAELTGQVGGYVGLALQGMITATMYRRAPMQALVTRPIEQATREAAKISGEDGSWAYLAPAILAVAQLRGVPAYQLYSFVAKQIPEAEKTPQEKLQKRLQTIEQRFSPEEIRRRVLQRAKNAGRVSIPLP